MTVVVITISDDVKVHPLIQDCLQKVVPPSCLQKKLLFGEETRVVSLRLVSLLIIFGDLSGIYAPLASVSLRICCVKISCLR